jgi:hypothetical protein
MVGTDFTCSSFLIFVSKMSTVSFRSWFKRQPQNPCVRMGCCACACAREEQICKPDKKAQLSVQSKIACILTHAKYHRRCHHPAQTPFHAKDPRHSMGHRPESAAHFPPLIGTLNPKPRFLLLRAWGTDLNLLLLFHKHLRVDFPLHVRAPPQMPRPPGARDLL